MTAELSIIFCSLFNQSLQTGDFPDCWQLSHVSPIYENVTNHYLQPLCFVTPKNYLNVLFLNTYITILIRYSPLYSRIL